jgi:ABC-type sugar transport system permease subunit
MAAAEPYGILNRYLPFLSGNNLVPDAPWVFVILTNGFIGASFGMILFASAIEAIPKDFMNAALVDGCNVWQRIRYLPFLSGNNLVPDAPWVFVILTNGFIGASFGMILFASAIESIPKDFMNAALVDGCNLWQRIRYLILPAIRWPLLFVTTFQTLSLLTSFEQIFILTDGQFGTEVWALWAYHRALSNYWGNFQWGFGAALAVVLVIIGAVAAVVYMRFFQFNELVQEPRIDAL